MPFCQEDTGINRLDQNIELITQLINCVFDHSSNKT